MNEIQIHTNGICTANDDADHGHDGDANLSAKDNTQNCSQHVNDELVDDSSVCAQDSNHLTYSEHVDAELGVPEKTSQVVESSSPSPANTLQTKGKGLGLKKWRRIRRDTVKKDANNSSVADSTKMLKRGFGNQTSDGSISSTNAIVHSPTGSAAADGFAFHGPSSGYRLPVDATFSAGIDSDNNSEDRSSKSSTAASAPKYNRHDASSSRAWGHHQRDKHKAKYVNASGRNLSAIGPRSQLGKGLGLDDSSKKPRGESVHLDHENSVSSLESDSRSCIYRVTSVISDQAQSGLPMSCGAEEAGYNAPGFEEQSVEQLRADSSVNADLSEDDSAWNSDRGKCSDPVVNSIMMLQSAQVALEREVQKFGDIGKGICFLWDDSSAQSLHVASEGCGNSASDCWGLKFNHASDSRLSEAEDLLKQKEMRIAELEANMKHMGLPLEDVQSSHKIFQEVEAELDSLFKQKVEAEVEYIAITRCSKDICALTQDQIKILKQQHSLAREQAESAGVIAAVENKAVMLQCQADKVDTMYRDMAASEEIQKMRRKVVKITSCFSVQLVLLILVVGLLVLHLSPGPVVVVPT